MKRSDKIIKYDYLKTRGGGYVLREKHPRDSIIEYLKI